MTIRKTLLVLISILALFVTVQSGKSFVSTFQKKSLYEFAAKSSESINLLLNSAGNWAVERGVTNAGLSAAGNASSKMLGIIAKRREDGNASYELAMQQIQDYEFNGKDKLLNDVQAAFRNAQEARKKADSNLPLSKNARDKHLMKTWVPTMSKLIMISQDLRFALTQETARIDSELGRQAQLRHFSWMMSEFSGRERAVLGGTISGGYQIQAGKLTKLSNFRGKVESGWGLVQKLSAESNHEVRDSVEKTRKVFFGSFQNLRESIYEAGLSNQAYPIGTQGWIDQSTAAINTILATQTASIAETEAYVDELLGSAVNNLLINALILIVSIMVVLVTLYIVVFRVTRPIEEMTNAMSVLAQGNTDVDIPALEKKDEIGRMASSVLVFKENAIERQKLRAEQEEAELRAEREKRKAMNALADSFEKRIQGVIQAVASASTELAQTAEHMAGIIEQSSRSAQDASFGAISTTKNVESVAASSEEMSATVNEISSQVQRSNELVSDSVDKVENADSHAQALADASHKVHEVVQLISDIAGQINLLALNATIESARAGEAGKGFAVVAGEVKNLASQTDRSIQEIEKVIGEMNLASENIVESLETIKQSIVNISEVSGSVASAIEEQSATTNEIASNMQSAATGTQKISANLEQISNDASQSQSASSQVLSAAQELSQQAETLKQEVHDFLDEIRTAE